MPGQPHRPAERLTTVLPPVRLLYLAGMGRSGSTLLERLIAETPQVCSLGEVVFLFERGILVNERCGCGEPFDVCPFWSEIGRIAFGGWANVDIERVAYLRRTVDDVARVPRLIHPGKGDFADLVAEYVQYYLSIYRAAQQLTGAAVVVDSSKFTSLAYCLRTSAEIDLQILQTVRDSRGVAYSWTKRVRRPEAVEGGEEFMPTFSPAYAAALWAGHNAILQILRPLGTPLHLAHYERFTQNPRAFLREVLEFVGMPTDDEALAAAGDDWVNLSVTHQVAGNPMRFQSGRIPVRIDEQWRTALPRRQRRLVSAIASPISLLLGYRPTPRRKPAA